MLLFFRERWVSVSTSQTAASVVGPPSFFYFAFWSSDSCALLPDCSFSNTSQCLFAVYAGWLILRSAVVVSSSRELECLLSCGSRSSADRFRLWVVCDLPRDRTDGHAEATVKGKACELVELECEVSVLEQMSVLHLLSTQFPHW